MTPEVQTAIQEIRDEFPDLKIEVGDEPQGGAYMIVHDLPIGEQYTPATSWVGFLVTFQYPNADVYPHFIDPDVARVDGAPMINAFQRSQNFWGRPAIQVSRRSNRWNPAVDTAAIKLAKVLEWIRSQ
jgi:hypothetical protein